jgi:hypothetical protein
MPIVDNSCDNGKAVQKCYRKLELEEEDINACGLCQPKRWQDILIINFIFNLKTNNSCFSFFFFLISFFSIEHSEQKGENTNE